MLIEQIHFPLGNNRNNSGSGWVIYVIVLILIAGVGYICYHLTQKETIAPRLQKNKNEKQ